MHATASITAQRVRRLLHTRILSTVVPNVLAILLLCCSISTVTASEPAAREYQVKAAFLYNFSRFVIWPGEIEDTFNLCVVGSNPFNGLLDTLIGKSVNNSIIIIEYHENIDTIDDCHLAYIGQSLEYDIERTMSVLRNMPILTISDIDRFTHAGGMIRFKLDNKKVRFDINIDAIDSSGLIISSKLLSLATIVKTGQ